MRQGRWERLQHLRPGRRSVLRGMAASGAAALIAACGSDSDKKSSVPASTATQATTAGQQQATPAAGGDFFSRLPENPPKDWADNDIKTGGTLTRLYNRQVTLDFLTTSGIGAELTTPVYSRLIRLSNRAGMKSVIQPDLEQDLAMAWEQPDKTTLIFTLAPNIKFHNLKPLGGRALTVDDIKYSINRGKTFPRSLYKAFYNEIQSVEEAGGGKVKLTLAEPYPAIQQMLAAFFMQIMPPEIGDNPDVAQNTAVGTGGMVLVKNTPNVEYVFQKHPEFFKTDAAGRKRPYIDGYTESVVMDEATRLALFEGGKADFSYGAASPITFDNAEDVARRNPKIVIQKRPQGAVSAYLVGHHNQAPWSDPRVRQAVALSLDRETIIKTQYRGQGIVGPWFPWPYLFEKPPGAKELGQNFTYDPKQAKQLLAAAGFPNGLDLDLTWYESPYIEQVLTLFKQSAAEAGLRINLIKSPDVASHNQKVSTKNWNGLILAQRGLTFVDPSATMPYFLPGNALNYGDVNDPQLVALNTRMENALGEERKAISRQVFDQLVTQMYDVSLPVQDILDAWSPRLKNWVDTTWTASGGHGMGSMDQVWIA